ncbi:multicopper oxidase [Lepidopterella palustris CBS 459.81]|uniref:laccase n=1 Tax=Lepidopterella palustris CBS 459.81 TaxID=1314670 RepID=A0A8E2JEN8_9PEZI|nr:multicopper oxidase [Lepidopterella palustris CBS 459.81]
MILLSLLGLFIAIASAVPAPQDASSVSTVASSTTSSAAVATCSGNTASDRSVWCDYDLNTDYYTDGPDTGVTVEYWLEVVNTTLAPDGYDRIVLAVNGTVPGPTIEANWGDTVIIHVTNSLTNNGTGIHWHGVRQNRTNQNDGVPSITQCPIAPGESLTYTWKATQYGTSWYHSHFSLQAWEGVFGPIIIHGPATSNYDEEVGTVFLNDWSHETVDALYSFAQTRGPPSITTGLINGMNEYDGSGTRYEVTFDSGTKYLIRLVNAAIDTHFKFSIDNHTMTVIATDFVPIVPYTTDVLDITMGQRYDIIVEADQDTADYWMRAIPQAECSNNLDSDNIRAIVRYDSTSTSDPTTTAYDYTDDCIDEDSSNLVPYLSQTVTSPTGDDLTVAIGRNSANLFRWQIGTESFQVEWDDPTILQVYEGNTTWSDEECVYNLSTADEWVYFVIETSVKVPHPIHLHGHDFFILASGEYETYDTSVTLNLDNPPRRDVATLPTDGYLVIAFLTDNPGVWLMHCHIGWHTSEGLALQFIERSSEISALVDYDTLSGTCSTWDTYVNSDSIDEDDSGV